MGTKLGKFVMTVEPCCVVTPSYELRMTLDVVRDGEPIHRKTWSRLCQFEKFREMFDEMVREGQLTIKAELKRDWEKLCLRKSKS
jgi:hypothetical protein